MDDSIDDITKDLLKNLLQPKSKDRLGNGQ